MTDWRPLHPSLPFLFLLSFLFPACSTTNDTKPPSIGRLSELVVVADSSLWKDPAGDTALAILAAPYPILPQEEPFFSLSTFTPSGFTAIVQKHRNILHVVRDEGLQDKPRVTLQRNVWADPQAVVTLTLPAGTPSGLSDACELARETLVLEERQRLILANKATGSKELGDAVFRHFGVRLYIPKDYVLAREEESFLWFRRETDNTSTGILVYDTPDLGTPEQALERRDSRCRQYIPGPVEGSYMVTDTAVAPMAVWRRLDDAETLVIRGLWRVEGDFMGGPFVSRTVAWPDRPKAITVEGFAYAPKFDKRDYVKNAEAIVFSLERPDGLLQQQ